MGFLSAIGTVVNTPSVKWSHPCCFKHCLWKERGEPFIRKHVPTDDVTEYCLFEPGMRSSEKRTIEKALTDSLTHCAAQPRKPARKNVRQCRKVFNRGAISLRSSAVNAKPVKSSVAVRKAQLKVSAALLK